jgi:hypothetical protein
MMLRAPARPDPHRLLWPLEPHRISCLLAMLLPVSGYDAFAELPCLQADCRVARLATMYLGSDGHYVTPRQHSVARDPGR